MGRVTHSLFRPQFSQPLGEINEQLFATGHWEGDLVQTRRDGALVNVVSSWTLRRDESKRPVSVIEMNYDVTARKKAEKELAQTREHLDTIVSSSLAALLHATADMAEAGLLPDPPYSQCERLIAARAEQAGWSHWPHDRIIPHDVEASNWPERWRAASGY